MNRDEKRRLLGERQILLMAESGERQMLVCYGEGLGEPGYCVTLRHGDSDLCLWFSHAERFSGVDAWLEQQLQTEPDED